MNCMSEILKKYEQASEERRMSMYLSYRELREAFNFIDQFGVQVRASEFVKSDYPSFDLNSPFSR